MQPRKDFLHERIIKSEFFVVIRTIIHYKIWKSRKCSWFMSKNNLYILTQMLHVGTSMDLFFLLHLVKGITWQQMYSFTLNLHSNKTCIFCFFLDQFSKWAEYHSNKDSLTLLVPRIWLQLLFYYVIQIWCMSETRGKTPLPKWILIAQCKGLLEVHCADNYENSKK